MQLFVNPYPAGSDDTRSRRQMGGVACINKTSIVSYQIAGNVISFVTNTQSPALTSGQVVVLNGFNTSTFLNGLALTVSATGLTTTTFQAPLTHANTALITESGYFIQPGVYATGGILVSISSSNLAWQIQAALGGQEIFSVQNPIPVFGTVFFTSALGASGSGANLTYAYNYFTGYLRIFSAGTELANAAAIPADIITWIAEFARAL